MKDWFLIVVIAVGMGVMGFLAPLLGPYSIFAAAAGICAVGACAWLIVRRA